MLRLHNFTDSDLMILGMAGALIASVLGLLSDVIMGARGFGPVRNSLIIFAGGLVGIVLRAAHYPVPANQELVASIIAGVVAATFALLIGSLAKKFLEQ